MKSNEQKFDQFSIAIMDVIQKLKEKDIKSSCSKIANAMVLNMSAPEPHNLMGILCEITGDDDRARKHYRAAYALDPTYKPACRNLERLVMFEWGSQRRDYDFGFVLPEDTLPKTKPGADIKAG